MTMAMANGFMEIEPLFSLKALMPLLLIFLPRPSVSPSQCRLAPTYPRAVVSGDGGGRASETCNFTVLLTIGTASVALSWSWSSLCRCGTANWNCPVLSILYSVIHCVSTPITSSFFTIFREGAFSLKKAHEILLLV